MTKSTEPKEIIVDGIIYVPKQTCAQRDGLEYCIVRTYSAGVFAGYVEMKNGREVSLRDARRLWYWDGAASLSQLAVDGVKAPQNCKFPVALASITLTEAIEIIPCTEKARKSITEVPIWER